MLLQYCFPHVHSCEAAISFHTLSREYFSQVFHRDNPPPDIIASLCSWNLFLRLASFGRYSKMANLCWILSWPFMFLSQQRIMQPSSRGVTDLLVKSSMQSLKHLSTSLEYICELMISHGNQALISGEEVSHTPMKSFICLFSMRVWSSCCSAALRLSSSSVRHLWFGPAELTLPL